MSSVKESAASGRMQLLLLKHKPKKKRNKMKIKLLVPFLFLSFTSHVRRSGRFSLQEEATELGHTFGL